MTVKTATSAQRAAMAAVAGSDPSTAFGLVFDTEGDLSDAQAQALKKYVDDLPEEEKIFGEPEWKMVNGRMTRIPTIRDTPFARDAMKQMADFMASQGGELSVGMDFSALMKE